MVRTFIFSRTSTSWPCSVRRTVLVSTSYEKMNLKSGREINLTKVKQSARSLDRSLLISQSVSHSVLAPVRPCVHVSVRQSARQLEHTTLPEKFCWSPSFQSSRNDKNLETFLSWQSCKTRLLHLVLMLLIRESLNKRYLNGQLEARNVIWCLWNKDHLQCL